MKISTDTIDFDGAFTVEIKCKSCKYREYTLKSKTCFECIFSSNYKNYKSVNSTLDSFITEEGKGV